MLRQGLSRAIRPQAQASLGLRPALIPALQRGALAPSRGIASSPLLLRRDDDRLPRGHVRPQRPRRQDDTNGRPEQQGPGAYGAAPGAFGGGYGDGAFGFGGGPNMAYANASVRPRVDVPSDPQGVLDSNHAAFELLAHDTLVVVRQLEMLNVFMGFEQANRYAIYTPDGQNVGFLAEEDRGMMSVFSRQFLHTHRPFKSVVMDRHGVPILWIRRPFAFINSRIKVFANESTGAPIVGETQQQWHPWRRRYNLFENRPAEDAMEQFARIDGGFLAWDFWLKNRDDELVASINRNFAGLGRELFTDTGQYVIRFDAAGSELGVPGGSEIKVQGQTIVLPEKRTGTGLTLDERAMTLATAVSIDFDYFSRHSGSGGMGLPLFMWGGGDGSSEAQRTGGTGTDTTSGTGEAAAGAAAGAAMGAGRGTGDAPQREWTDDEIYGRAPPPDQWGDAPAGPPHSPPVPGQQAEGFDWPHQFPGDMPDADEEIMQDPWDNGSDGGMLGGGGGGGGDGGGSWGDWGDWS